MLHRKLSYVVATARAGSFTAAADRVGVTQSAITKGVADLERQLGYLIFNRTAHGIIVTEEGRAFVERAARILDDTQDLLRGSMPGSDPFAGYLKIGVCPASLDWVLVNPLGSLITRHPSIRLEVTGTNFERAVQHLRAGTIDVALGFEAAFVEQPDFRLDSLPPIRTTFFVRNGHPILDCETVTDAEIAKYVLISSSDSRPYDSMIRRIYEAEGVEAHTKLHFIDYFPLAARIVARSDAIGIASIDYANHESFKRRFTRVPYLDSWPLASLCIATRLRSSPRPAVRAFIKACRDQIEDA
ncbi:MAG: LysR family transcriptional regulator [Sphingomonas sp.]|uniref:LysR family transcriptional regulator n=1 Tax=Sphingomonas sp. TaxID=28214 RepID=UPI003F80161A